MPREPMRKLAALEVPSSLGNWVLDLLTCGSQSVRTLEITSHPPGGPVCQVSWSVPAIIEAVTVAASRFPRFNLSIYCIPIYIVCLIL